MSDTPQKSSQLRSLKARHQEVVEKLYDDVKVEHWDDAGDPPVFVRYQPIDHDLISTTMEKIRKFKPSGRRTRAEFELECNADLLIRGCVGVFTRTEDGTEYSLNSDAHDGPWTTFDNDLAFELGLIEDKAEETSSARAVCRALFLTEGDLLSHATHLIKFSGYKVAEAEEQMRGES